MFRALGALVASAHKAMLCSKRLAPNSPTGRGSRLKICTVWVRIPVGGQLVREQHSCPRGVAAQRDALP